MSPTDPLAALASHAELQPHRPWLFHAEGWDWFWHSWARTADHVARGVEAIRRAPVDLTTAPRIGFAARQTPSSIAAGLAIQAAGATAVPIGPGPADPLERAADAGCTAWAMLDDERLDGESPPASATRLHLLELPPALGSLSRTSPRALELAGSEGAIGLAGAEDLDRADLAAAAQHIAGRLSTSPTGNRPVVCISRTADIAEHQKLLAWILVHGAAWVLDDDAETFADTVLWARPTHLFANARESPHWPSIWTTERCAGVCA